MPPATATALCGAGTVAPQPVPNVASLMSSGLRPVPTAGTRGVCRAPRLPDGGAHPDTGARQRLGGGGGQALLERRLVVERQVLGDEVRAGRGELAQAADVVRERLAGAGEQQLRARCHVVDDLEHAGALVAVAGVDHPDVRRQLALGHRVGQVSDAVRHRADPLTAPGQADPMGDASTVQGDALAGDRARVHLRPAHRPDRRHPGQRRHRVELVDRHGRVHQAGLRQRGAGHRRELRRGGLHRHTEPTQLRQLGRSDGRGGVQLEVERAAGVQADEIPAAILAGLGARRRPAAPALLGAELRRQLADQRRHLGGGGVRGGRRGAGCRAGRRGSARGPEADGEGQDDGSDGRRGDRGSAHSDPLHPGCADEGR